MNAPARAITKEDNQPVPLVTPKGLSADNAVIELAIAELERRAAETPSVIEDDEDLALVVALGGDVSKETKRVEDTRATTKKPYFDAGKVIDAYFNTTLASRLAQIATPLSKAAKSYLDKKAAKEREDRAAREADAKRQADEAAAKLAEAVKGGDIQEVKVASAAVTSLDQFASKASREANAKPADLARTTTAAGTATLAESWTFTDLDLNTIDLEVLRPFLPQTSIEQALRAYIKAGRRQIKGARIYAETSARFKNA